MDFAPINFGVESGIGGAIGIHTEEPVHWEPVEFGKQAATDEFSIRQFSELVDHTVAGSVCLCGVQISGVGEPDQIVQATEAADGVAEHVGTAHQNTTIGINVVVASLDRAEVRYL